MPGFVLLLLVAAGMGWHEYRTGHQVRSDLIAQQKEVINEIDAYLAELEPN